jgi:hypothetical protein
MGRADVCQVVLVVAPDDLDWFRETYRPNLAFMDVQLTAGGACRAESVRNGLTVLNSAAEYVAVHDAARPLLTAAWIDSVFAAAVQHKAAIPGLRLTSTIKRVNGADRSRKPSIAPDSFRPRRPRSLNAACWNDHFPSADDLPMSLTKLHSQKPQVTQCMSSMAGP